MPNTDIQFENHQKLEFSQQKLIHDKILILDFGSQFTQLIARRIRELNVYCEIHPWNIKESFIPKFAPCGIILSGGPASAYENLAPRAPQIVFTYGVPVLGICYGMQTMAVQLGGTVESTTKREFGYATLYDNETLLLENLMHSAPNEQNIKNNIKDNVHPDANFLPVWMSHGDNVTKLPNGFTTIARSNSCPIAAIADVKRNFYGIQFHPEVTHTQHGTEIMRRFILQICKCNASWNMPNYLTKIVADIKQKVGDDKVIVALSGGVDSSVTALLIERAIHKNLVCIFVDNGFLRHNEAHQVMQIYRENLQLNVIKIDAQREFYQALKGISDPEKKRKIIGNLFIKIFQREANKIQDVKWLAQGTIYPDVIESASSTHQTAHSIKSHHNVGGLPESMHLNLLEPLRELFKDEVRSLGSILGIPKELLMRHPFPGPGLAIRIMGEIKPEFISLLRLADHIFIEMLKQHNLYTSVSQAFAVFLPIKTVGVMGDGRTYDYLISLRAVETTDFMTANVANLPFEFITSVANRIINEVQGINRVVYDISGKPPATIEWE